MNSYVSLDDLDDIGSDEAIAAEWNVIYSAFNNYEKDRRLKHKE